MTVDILNNIVSIILFTIILWIAWEGLKLFFKFICWLIDFTIGKFFDGIDLIANLGSALLTVVFAFIIVIGALWFIFPSSFYLDIHNDNQNFDLGVPLIEFTGTYEKTNTGYIIKPSLYQIPISSTFTINQKDSTHLNLFTDFVRAKDQHIKGVTRFVPDR